MAALNWRPIDAPDFRGTLDGFQTASRMFGDAFSGLQAGLKNFDQGQSDQVNKAVLASALAESDPEAFKRNLASGTYLSGVDPRRISAETLNFLAGREGTLLNQQHEGLANQELTNTIDKSTYEFGRTKASNAAADAADPILRQAAMLAASGADGQAKASAYLSDPKNAAILGQLHASQLVDAIKTNQGLNEGDLSLAGKRTSNDSSAFNLGKDKTEYADRKAADALVAAIIPNATTADEAERLLNSHSDALKNMSPSAVLLARAALHSQFPDSPAFSGGGGGGGAVGGMGGGAALPGGGDYSSVPFEQVKNQIIGHEAGPSVGGYDAVAYNKPGGGNAAGVKPPKPISQMTLGELYDWQTGPMRAATKGQRGPNDIGSTGVGAYQFESGTLAQNAQQVYGANWRDQKFTPEAQDAIAKNLYNTVRSDPNKLANTWAAFQANRQNLAAQTAGVTTANMNNMMGDPGRPITKDFLAGWDNQSSDLDVAKSLIAPGGPMEGAPVERVLSKIREIKQDNGVNAALAGAILHRNIKPMGVLDEIKNVGLRWGGSAFGNWGGLTVDENGISADGKRFKGGDISKDVIKAQTQEQSLAASTSAQQLVQQAQQNLMAAAQRAQQTGRHVDLAPYQQALDQAIAMSRGYNQYGAQVAIAGRNGPPPAAPSPVNQLVNTAKPSSADTRRFGPLGIYVPAGKFQTHEDLMNFVNQKTSMIQDAQGIMRLGGQVGQQYRQQFQKQYGVSPEQAVAQLKSLQG